MAGTTLSQKVTGKVVAFDLWTEGGRSGHMWGRKTVGRDDDHSKKKNNDDNNF